ncbi:MAG: hypothetical protein JXR34_13525 [Bacteroidales bacterium]|nr:hypothetical protein [Bacteroidales bacterium]
MEITTTYIPATIAILGVAYPILLQVIARLDDKYSSDRIVKLFKEEWEYNWFKRVLIVDLIFILIWSSKFEPLFQIDGLNYLISHSAELLVAIATISLVVIFFFYTWKIIKYYTTSEIISYLIQKHDKTQENDVSNYFEALADILMHVIKNKDNKFSKDLLKFFYNHFKNIREIKKGDFVVYPTVYYETVYNAIEKLTTLKPKRNYVLESRTAGGIWLLGEFQDHRVSDTTYAWLWQNIRVLFRNDASELVVSYWQTAHHFFSRNLEALQEEYGGFSGGKLIVLNDRDVTENEKERRKFLAFHHALGGLLLYQREYNVMKRCWNYTSSEPPQYELLPDSMFDVFDWFNYFRDPHYERFPFLGSLYSFPDQDGMQADYEIKKWICSYIVLLFLRQYTIRPYLITMKPLDLPRSPAKQREIKEWLEGIEFFRELLTQHLDNQKMLEKLGLGFITKEWCEGNSKAYPTDFIDKLDEQLEHSYKRNAQNFELDEAKVLQLKETSKGKIKAAYNKLQRVSNKQNSIEEPDKWYVNGMKMLWSKDAYVENPEAHYIDFDSFMAEEIAGNVTRGLSQTFQIKTKGGFLLKPTHIFEGLKNLNLDESFVLVSFGFNFDLYINHYHVPGLSEDYYNGTRIVSFAGNSLVQDSIFILKEEDLPSITSRQLDASTIEKYELGTPLCENPYLYASVIDMNKATPEIFAESKGEKTDDELKKQALVSLALIVEIAWKKDVRIIHIMEYSEYRQQGTPNDLKDVKWD